MTYRQLLVEILNSIENLDTETEVTIINRNYMVHGGNNEVVRKRVAPLNMVGSHVFVEEIELEEKEL